jgi:hypothetical protein
MAIDPKDIIDVSAPPMTTADRLFLPAIFKGLGTTFRHMLGNV